MKSLRDEWCHIVNGKFIILIMIVPLLVALIFGYIFKNSTVQEAQLAIVDLDHSNYSSELIEKLDTSQYIQALAVFDNAVEPDLLLYNERFAGVLYLPEGLEKAYIQGKPINLGLAVDMTMPANSAAIRTGVSEIIGTENVNKGLSGVIVLEQRTLYNPTSQSIMNSVVMFVNVVMLLLLVSNTISIVPRLRQDGVLNEELTHNPIGILVRALPYAFISTAALYLALGAMKQIGGLRFEANWLQLFVPFFLYGYSTTIMSLAIGWTALSPAKASGRLIIVILPSFLLSGAQAPYALLPAPLQWINQILPLSLHFKFLRGMGYKGGELIYFIPELGHYLVIIGALIACILVLIWREIISLERARADDESLPGQIIQNG